MTDSAFLIKHSLILAKILKIGEYLFSEIRHFNMKKQLILALGLNCTLSVLIAQVPDWNHIPGPDGGSIENFDLDGTLLYALTKSGIYSSKDEGYHWVLLPHSLATTRDKRQFRAENGIFYALDKKGSLVRSDDLGASWHAVLQKPFPFDFETEYLQKLFVKGDTLLVGSFFTIYRSTNRGETWTTTADLVPASFVSIFEFKNEIFAAQDRYIYRSADGGSTWEQVFANFIGYTAVVATDSFLLAFYGNRARLVRSRDGLRTWDAIDTDTLVEHLEEDPYGSYTAKWVGGSGQNLYFFQTGDVHYFCPIRFCYSSDGGDTWHRGDNGNQVRFGRDLNDGISFGNHIVIGSNQIQHSVDSAQTFFIQQHGLMSAKIGYLIRQDNTAFTTTHHERGFRSIDKGESWEAYSFPSFLEDKCSPNVVFIHTNKRIFRIIEDMYIFEASYSEDNGQTWKVFEVESLENFNSTNHVFWYQKITWESGNYENRILKLSDTYTAFVEIKLLNPTGYYHNVRLIGFGDQLGIEVVEGFFIFDEKGDLIRELPALPCNSFSLSSPGRIHFDGNTYYNFCDDRAFILPHRATEWQEIYPQDWTTGIPLYHSFMTFFASHNGVVWVGLEGKGLFYATDNTGRFYPAQPQMPYPYPTAISVDENSVWVGTNGGGIWTYPLPKTSIKSAKEAVFRVFPNPSAGELNLQSDQFIKEEISFALLDASGRIMAKEVLSPGQYWNLEFTGLPKGLYFLQMRTESYVYGIKWVVGN